MSQNRCKRASSVEQRVLELQQSRKTKKPKVAEMSTVGWEAPIDVKSSRFFLKTIDSPHHFITFDVGRDPFIIDIFRAQLSDEIIKKIIWRRFEENSQTLLYSDHSNMKITFQKMYQFLAVQVYIQGNSHLIPRETEKVRPQESAINRSLLYFSNKYPDIEPVIGTSFVRRLIPEFCISSAEMKILNDNWEEMIVRLGEYINGDEKILFFKGNSPFIRVCPSKPGEGIGHWHYELAAVLENELPVLIKTSLHGAVKSYGEKIPTSKIVREWSELIQEKGHNNTFVTMDSYYLDNAGRKYLLDNNIISF